MPPPSTPPPTAVTTAGKWLRAGGARWHLRGVSYGPFQSNPRGEPFPTDDRRAEDFARIRRLGFGAYDPQGGGVVRGARVFAQPTCHHRPEVVGGVEETAAAALLRAFFAERR